MITPSYIDVTLNPGTFRDLAFDVSGLAEGVYEITIEGSPEAGVVTLVVGQVAAPALNVVAIEALPDPCPVGTAYQLRATIANQGNASGTADIQFCYYTTAGARSNLTGTGSRQTVTLAPGQSVQIQYNGGSATVPGGWLMAAYSLVNGSEAQDYLNVVPVTVLYGSIRVSIVGADPASAPVYLDGAFMGSTANGVLLIIDVEPGPHDVAMGDVVGYSTPPSLPVTVVAGQEVGASFDYLMPGEIRMSNLAVSPAEINTAQVARVTVRATNPGEQAASKRVVVTVTKVG